MEAWCGDMTPRVWDITDVDPSEGMGGASERFSGATDLTRNDSLNSKASGGSGGGRKSVGGDVTPPLTVKGPSFGDGEPGPSLMELGQQKETERLKRRASVDPMLLLGIRESDDSLMIAQGGVRWRARGSRAACITCAYAFGASRSLGAHENMNGKLGHASVGRHHAF